MKAAIKRKRFFDESLKLIHEKGFKATTMRDIAERMNFEGVANVYNYIESKNSLLEGFIFDIVEEFGEGIRNIANSSYSPTDKIRSIIAMHCHMAFKKPFEIGLTTSEWRNLQEPKLSEFLKETMFHEHVVQGIIEEGVNNGEFAEVDPYIAMMTVLTSLRWLYAEYAKRGKELNPIEVEKQIMHILISGLCKRNETNLP